MPEWRRATGSCSSKAWRTIFVGTSQASAASGLLSATLTGPIIATPLRFIADGDFVVVEALGSSTAKNGIPYNNKYCFVFRLSGGKLREVTEYMDTELATAALGGGVIQC